MISNFKVYRSSTYVFEKAMQVDSSLFTRKVASFITTEMAHKNYCNFATTKPFM